MSEKEIARGFLPPEMITAQITHTVASWFKATNGCFINLNLFRVLFYLLRFHIYKTK